MKQTIKACKKIHRNALIYVTLIARYTLQLEVVKWSSLYMIYFLVVCFRIPFSFFLLLLFFLFWSDDIDYWSIHTSFWCLKWIIHWNYKPLPRTGYVFQFTSIALFCVSSCTFCILHLCINFNLFAWHWPLRNFNLQCLQWFWKLDVTPNLFQLKIICSSSGMPKSCNDSFVES